jgi:alpha-tubulin suppressor-like RCC1 family protein
LTPAADGDDVYSRLEAKEDPESVAAVVVLSVACGKTHSMALTDCGLYSWGSSKYGQLGLGREKQVSFLGPVLKGLSHSPLKSVRFLVSWKQSYL